MLLRRRLVLVGVVASCCWFGLGATERILAAPPVEEPVEPEASTGVLLRPDTARALILPTASWQVAWQVAPGLPAQNANATQRHDDPVVAELLHWAYGLFGNTPAVATTLAALPPLLRAAVAPAVAPTVAPAVASPKKSTRVAALYATTEFVVDGAPLQVLQLRVRYRDALAVAINGWVVARRNWPRAQGSAARPHGPEWETFYIAVAPGLLAPGRNTLSLQVRPFRKRAEPELAVELWAAPDVRIVRGPLVQRVTSNAAAVVVETAAAVPASLRWWGANGANERTPDAGPDQGRTVSSPAGLRHVFDLTGLPSGAIKYEVQAGASVLHGTFFTAPPADAIVRLAIYGDVRGGHDVHRRIVEAMQGEAPDAVLTTGDMVLRGSDEADWQRFFAVIAPLAAHVPYYPSIGNHDLGRAGDGSRRALAMFALPPAAAPDGDWYSYDIAGVHLVFLDSNHYEQAAQLTWLENDLRAARSRKVRAIIALTHAGPWSRGVHRGSKLARERYVPLLAQFHVDVLFSGHEHLYQRGEFAGLRYIVSGGGGASLYSILCGTPEGKPCAIPDGMEKIEKVHHYVMVTVTKQQLEVCPRLPDGSPLEACLQWPLGR